MTHHLRSLDLVRSPKLDPVTQRWYRYYAGFRPEFVNDICDAFDAGPGWSALDPWMGSGTTLSVAAGRGASVSGLDLNPAMVIVAKGRLLARDTLASVDSLANDILRHWTPSTFDGNDPLGHWLSSPTAKLVRGLSSRIHQVLVGPEVSPVCDSNAVSSLASFFYVALFETVTTAVRSYGSRNPTWIKKASNYEGTVSLTRTQVEESFLASVKRLTNHLRQAKAIDVEVHDLAQLYLSDSRAMPFEDARFDAIISSPPYLTRLDYVMGHAPELAVLGLDGDDIRQLRDGMIGTPTRRQESIQPALGTTAESLLSRVADHESYAAKSYYEPNFRQYFTAMARSFDEIQRVAKPGADIALVVQDSRFKDIHIDLANAMIDMGAVRGWTAGPRKDFVNVRSMAQLNKAAHPIARSTKPIESVVTFTTAA